MAGKEVSNRADVLIQKMDEITQLADQMILLPVRPCVSEDDFLDFSSFDGSTKYQDGLHQYLGQKLKNFTHY